MSKTRTKEKAVPIRTCRLCHSRKLLRVVSLGNQYVSDFVTGDGESLKSPLDLVRCGGCELVQLKHTFPRESLYRQYWYKSGISGTMRRALSDIVAKACRMGALAPSDLVIDIGCNDGTLLRQYKIPGLRLIGFEPARNLVDEARRGTDFIFNDFFTYQAFREKFGDAKAKIITSIAMFYDIDDPNSFVVDVAKSLDPDGVWVIQQNYLPAMLENNGFDNIGHEHLTYYSLGTLARLLKAHDLQIFHAETNDVNGGSFRTYVSHKGRFPVRESVGKMARYEARLFSKKPPLYRMFAENIRRIRSELRSFILNEVKSGKRVYVYGASTRGNTILQYCGLDHRLIQKATDANREKWGRNTVGTLIPIIPKEQARKEKPDYFLILPHHFLREITLEEKEYLESGGKFIVPLPKFRVITLDHVSR